MQQGSATASVLSNRDQKPLNVLRMTRRATRRQVSVPGTWLVCRRTTCRPPSRTPKQVLARSRTRFRHGLREFGDRRVVTVRSASASDAQPHCRHRTEKKMAQSRQRRDWPVYCREPALHVQSVGLFFHPSQLVMSELSSNTRSTGWLPQKTELPTRPHQSVAAQGDVAVTESHGS